jgi:hypothetical protein
VLSVVCCVGHRNRRAIDELDLTPAPLPRLSLTRAQALGNRAAQSLHQPQRQTLAGLAIRPRVQAARGLIKAHLLAHATGYRVLAAVIRAHDLFDEQHYGSQWSVHPLSIGSHLLADPAFQLRQRDDLAQQCLPRLHKLRRKLLHLPVKLLDLATIHWG